MEKIQKYKVINCDHPAMTKGEMNITVPGEVVVAWLQAFEFVSAHKEEFQKEVTECDDCWKNIDQFRDIFIDMIEKAITHYRDNHTN